MFTKIRLWFEKFFRFWSGKPFSSEDWRWVHEQGDLAKIDSQKPESTFDSRDIYVPRQLDYYFPKSERSDKKTSKDWDSEKLIALSQEIGKAYCPGINDSNLK